MSQTRHGDNNEPIRVPNFRSMTVMEAGDNFTPVRHDPRVIRLGQLLRRTNIDELPKLFNVLAGNKSIAGACPHPTAQNEGICSADFVIFRSPQLLSCFFAARWARRPANEQARSHPTKGGGS
jgi:lipopolysaccharide/colanic/teichoic acid biosynthesis glycosyltransferase